MLPLLQPADNCCAARRFVLRHQRFVWLLQLLYFCVKEKVVNGEDVKKVGNDDNEPGQYVCGRRMFGE